MPYLILTCLSKLRVIFFYGIQNNFSLHGAFWPLVPFTFFSESCSSSDRAQAAVNLSPPPPLSALQVHLPGVK